MNAEPIFRKILSQNEICILATASKGGKPEAATIEYASDDRFNVYFETFTYYRKYKNIKENPCGSIVLNDLPRTIQMDGKITELSGKEAEKAKQLLAKKYGKERSFYYDKRLRFFRFTPSWIRILIGKGWPPEYHAIKPTKGF